MMHHIVDLSAIDPMYHWTHGEQCGSLSVMYLNDLGVPNECRKL